MGGLGCGREKHTNLIYGFEGILDLMQPPLRAPHRDIRVVLISVHPATLVLRAGARRAKRCFFSELPYSNMISRTVNIWVGIDSSLCSHRAAVRTAHKARDGW